LKLHRLAAANDHLRVAEPCSPGNIDMNTAPNLNTATAITATDPTLVGGGAEVAASDEMFLFLAKPELRTSLPGPICCLAFAG